MTTASDITATEIIKSLGGVAKLAARPELNSSRSAVSNWLKYGIPSRLWPAIARIAAENDATAHIKMEQLERQALFAAKKPSKREAA